MCLCEKYVECVLGIYMWGVKFVLVCIRGMVYVEVCGCWVYRVWYVFFRCVCMKYMVYIVCLCMGVLCEIYDLCVCICICVRWGVGSVGGCWGCWVWRDVLRIVLLCMVCMFVLICVCVRDVVYMEVFECWMWEGVVWIVCICVMCMCGVWGLC